ncbi:DUF6764 family protein [Rhodococcoides kyotonense]|uniref:Protein kinase n=1 Tax=Rhodococcoides kyotonense TaxID=398843 RepID=A0A239JKE1_9NOCA|nr:DUF6764 family protein [Rhodococcus kyotonensis]SNT06259.1 hypothetical protein SAMN05421642_108277 [Rhodococcus kyotonensis]
MVGIGGDIGRTIALIGSAAALGIAATLLSSGTATAADLSCTPAPGTDTVSVDGTSACGVRIDDTSSAYARAVDAVAFARADLAGGAFGLASSGGVAAAETVSGRVGAVSTGRDSVSIVSPDPGAIALAVSLERGQTFVGTVEEGVLCNAGAGLAVNVTTGQVCLSDGITSWSSVVALP